MDDHFGTVVNDGGLQLRKVANVSVNGADTVRHLGELEQIRLGWRVKRVSRYFGSQRIQPQGKPASFEAGVPSEEDVTPLPE